MNKQPRLPDIPEAEQPPIVKALLALLEQYSTHIVLPEETVAGLKVEINILKGKRTPWFQTQEAEQINQQEIECHRGPAIPGQFV